MSESASLEAMASLVALGKRAREAASAAELGFVIVNETLQMVRYRQSALWVRGRGLSAVSGLPEIDANTPYSLWLAQVLAVQGEGMLPGQARPFGMADLSPALAQDWSDWLPGHALLLSLDRPGSSQRALWLLARDEAWTEAETGVLQELAAIYAHARLQYLPPPTWRQRVKVLLGDVRRRRIVIGAALLLALLPVRLTVLAPAEVVPKDALMVRAPLDGVIDRLHVKPNQAVQAGQPLFDLDTTGLRTRHGVAGKAYEAAAEEYRQAAQLAVSDDDKGRMEMSQRKGRMEEKAAELAYSEQLLARVQVKAPRDGVLVFADANDWVGKGVAIGERVMQIADPNKVEIALRLPVADAIELDEHAALTLFLPTAANYSYEATVSYSAYRADAGADGIVAYKFKAEFVPGQSVPRLGLTGTAKLHGRWVPACYWVLRRPLAALRQFIGW